MKPFLIKHTNNNHRLSNCEVGKLNLATLLNFTLEQNQQSWSNLTSWSIYSSYSICGRGGRQEDKRFESCQKETQCNSPFSSISFLPSKPPLIYHHNPQTPLLYIITIILESGPQRCWWNPCFGTIWIFLPASNAYSYTSRKLLDVGMHFAHNSDFARLLFLNNVSTGTIGHVIFQIFTLFNFAAHINGRSRFKQP